MVTTCQKILPECTENKIHLFQKFDIEDNIPLDLSKHEINKHPVKR